MREENSTAKGFLILSLAGMVSKVLSVFYMPLLTAILGDGGFGIYGNAYAVFIFFYAITTTGTQPAVSKIVSEYVALDNEREAIKAFKFTRNVLGLIGGAITLILILFAFPIANMIKTPSAGYAIIALAPCVCLTCILSAYRGYFQAKGNMKAIGLSQVLEQALNIIVSLVFAYLLVQISVPYGVAGGTIGTGVGAFVGILLLIYLFGKMNYEEDALLTNSPKASNMGNKKTLNKLIRYGVPVTLTAVIQNLGSLIDVGNINSRLLSAGFSVDQKDILNGYVGQYNQFLGVPMVIVTSLGNAVLPKLSQAMAIKDRRTIKKNINYAFKMVFVITIPSAIGLAMVREELYSLMFGKADASYLMFWGAGTLILMGITYIQGIILQGINKQMVVLKTFIIGIVLKITCNYFLVGIEEINILGVIIGNYMLYLVPLILNNKEIRKAMKVRVSLFRFAVKPVISGILMAIGIFATKEFFELIVRFVGHSRWINLPMLLGMVGVGAFIYVYVMIVLAGIRKRDIDGFSPKIYRYIPRFMRKQMRQ